MYTSVRSQLWQRGIVPLSLVLFALAFVDRAKDVRPFYRRTRRDAQKNQEECPNVPSQ